MQIRNRPQRFPDGERRGGATAQAVESRALNGAELAIPLPSYTSASGAFEIAWTDALQVEWTLTALR